MRFETKRGGTPLDPDEAEGLKLPLATQIELETAEGIAIAEAVGRLQRISKRTSVLDASFAFECHKIMFLKVWKWAGKVRLTEKSIGVEPWRIRVELNQLNEDTKVWIEYQTYEPTVILARYHHRLVWIHCFVNGNGRHARVMTDLLAQQIGHPLPSWGSQNGLSREEYLQSLRQADSGSIEQLTIFMFS